MLKVSIVIPNWNGKELLKVCLPSIFKQSFQDFEVIVVDNGSLDGSVEYIEQIFPTIKIIKLTQNAGFAPAVNKGIQKAKGEYVVLLNNDTRVDKKCLEYLVKAADLHPEVGMVAAKMLNFYNPKYIDSAGDYIDTVGHANNIGLGKVDSKKYNNPGYIFLVTGGGGLFKKEVFKKVGLLDKDYFAYFEDVDLCIQAQMQGLKGWFEPKAIIYHMHKATSKKNSKLTEYLQFRNMTMTIIKDFPNELLKKDFNWLKIILVNINTIRYLSSQGYLMSALKAEWYIISHLAKLLAKRKKIQSGIKVPVETIIKEIKPKKVTLFGLLKSSF